MGNKVGAILLDTRSIQRYVFGCNELKTNTGASYIVDNIFDELMCEKILPEFSKNIDVNWRNNKEVQMLTNPELEYEVAYIGGGNMLLLVRAGKNADENLDMCRKIVSMWSKELLLYAPGLKTGAAVGEIDISREAFKQSLDVLYKQLKENQNLILPNVDLPCTGFTKECDVSGKTADAYDYSTGEKRMVAAEVAAKIAAYRYAVAENKDQYNSELGQFQFCSDISKIGYLEGESYISVIHIDGNNMGVKFSCCETIDERKQLSMKVASVVNNSLKKLLEKIAAEYDSYANFLDMDKLKQNGKCVLPIRPIIIGGDDITFVCPGRLGLEYAKYFVEEAGKQILLTDEQHHRMEKTLTGGKKLSKSLSCCAGVAVVPAKYPFFRAYELAEQLCGAAKKYSRQNDDKWLDFAILHGEMTPALEQLRKQQYVNLIGKKLHFGPYKIGAEAKDILSIEKLLELSDKLNAEKAGKGDLLTSLKKKAAQNKVKKLREVLCGDIHGIARYLEISPEVEDVLCSELGKDEACADDFWQCKHGENEESTRFIDAIEIMDFLPKW